MRTILGPTSGAAAFPSYARLPVAFPLPCRGGVGVGLVSFLRGEQLVNNRLADNELQTPPLPLPLKGGEWLAHENCPKTKAVKPEAFVE